METDVLIVGAGPTGLVLALWLRKLGVRVRIVDRSEGPGETSRALAVHARTLEFYNQIGLAKDVVAAGIKVESITVRERARAVGHLSLGDFGTGLSPFPFVLALPQDVHERILVACLEREGLLVERDSEVTGFAPKQDRVVATVVRKGKTEVVEAAYLCGCDGAHSMVRHTLGVGFSGGTNPEVFYVADVIGSGAAADGGLDVCMTRDGFCIVLPVRQTGSVRLIGIVPREHETNQAITFDDVRASVSTSTGLSIEAVNWFSTYHVSHRVAEQFRVGRVFLLGDACHVHSPAGGQGMNTGIGDAVNLAWKLAAVVQNRADAVLLDSYEPERIAFARRLVRTTDRLFRLVATRSAIGGVWRESVVPRLVSAFSRLRPVLRMAFRSISQIEISYRHGPIGVGSAGSVHGGDRLPWVEGPDGGNSAPLTGLDWQVHVYGTASEPLRTSVQSHGLELVAFPWTEAAQAAGLARDAAYLVRPDGYVALAEPQQRVAELEGFLSRLHIVARTKTPSWLRADG
jgi:2-polyprenyl-6-methoxyphenol hydroxylase-like FAD-dependent oxidoreductase